MSRPEEKVLRMTDPCFTLRVRLFKNQPMILIRAYDDMVPGWDSAGRVRLTCEVRQGGKVVFPKGQLYCALHGSSDGLRAKELVMSLVAMTDRDTDEEYFSDYTQDQLDWARANGEALSCESSYRYCDPETGSPRA